MSIKCGIIGIKGSGKTTLFNCLTNSNVELNHYGLENYQVNVGISQLLDSRLDFLHSVVKSNKKVYSTIEFIDVPGISVNKNANRQDEKHRLILSEARKANVLVHVIRCFHNSIVSNTIDIIYDKEFLELELQLKDLEQIEKKLSKIEKIITAGQKQYQKAFESLKKMQHTLQNFGNIRQMKQDNIDKELIMELQLLTSKPLIYLLNIDEKGLDNTVHLNNLLSNIINEEGSNVISISAKLEYEIQQIHDPSEKILFFKELGIDESVNYKLSKKIFEAMDLITFYTLSSKENRAWVMKKGKTVYEAAGMIHSDMQRGFIKAEVISFKDMQEYKSEQLCREKGKVRLEGKNYVVQDGDIIYIRFNI